MDIKQFRGDANTYDSIATRGNQTIGLSLSYLIHQNIGCVAVRFVMFGEVDIAPFTHFVVRESAQFLKLEDGKDTDEKFVGARLNKTLIPLLKPAPKNASLSLYMEKFAIYQKIAEWVMQQVDAEGFESTVNMLTCVKSQLGGVSDTQNGVAEVGVAYPDLTEQKKQYLEYLAAKKKQKEVEEDLDDAEDTSVPYKVN